jgi:hypothetical protein
MVTLATEQIAVAANKGLCKCGCGELIDKYDKKGRERFYIRGHCSRNRSLETRQKISQSKTGSKHSEQSKLKMSLAKKGQTRPYNADEKHWTTKATLSNIVNFMLISTSSNQSQTMGTAKCVTNDHIEI